MTPLLLLPGMMCDQRLFAQQVDVFSKVLPVEVMAISKRKSITNLAKDVLKSAPPKFSLLGLSMGGIVAMEILRLERKRVERVALMDTNPLAEKDYVQERRLSQIEAVKMGKLEQIMREEMKPNYLAEGPNKGTILDLCMDMATKLGPSVFIAQSLALMHRQDQQDTLKSLDIPALVLCGREDTLCPLERHELMHDLIPKSTLEVIDGAGHMPVLEQPTITNKKIREWLEI